MGLEISWGFNRTLDYQKKTTDKRKKHLIPTPHLFRLKKFSIKSFPKKCFPIFGYNLETNVIVVVLVVVEVGWWSWWWQAGGGGGGDSSGRIVALLRR